MFREHWRAWLAAALLLSLMVNLFLAGAISGRWFASLDPVREALARSPNFAARIRALPPDERARFNAAYEPHRDAVVQARDALRAARLSAFGAIGAPIYDPAVVRQDFAAVRDATQAAEIATQAALLDALAVLTPPARAMLSGQ